MYNYLLSYRYNGGFGQFACISPDIVDCLEQYKIYCKQENIEASVTFIYRETIETTVEIEKEFD